MEAKKNGIDLPQLDDDLFLTDGGLETTLIFHEGMELPSFAAFVLLDREEGREALLRYYRTYVELARDHGLGIILDTPTWRASSDWGRQLGYEEAGLADANRRAVELIAGLRPGTDGQGAPGVPIVPIVIGGSIGPRGDGYTPGAMMSAEEATEYHAGQIEVLADTEADFISALTFNYVEEAIGVARACSAARTPLGLSFTVETDGRLPTGQSLRDAIEAVDEATDAWPAYYMVNCAHPTHFAGALESGDPWIERIRGLRANASALSHAELDEAEELDAGDPEELSNQLVELRARLPHVNVLGGCCGTDHRHLSAMARAGLAGA